MTISVKEVVPIEDLTLGVTLNNTDYFPISQNGITKKITFATLSSFSTQPSLATGKIWVGISGTPTAVTPSGDATISTSGVITLATNVVSNAKFRQSAALSVVGNAANSTANVSDITAASDGMVFMRLGTSLAFSFILNANISPSAAIAYSKLNLLGSIVNSDIGLAAGIVYSKLDLSNSITNSDVNTGAAIALSKLGTTFFSKSIGTITSGQTIDTNFSRALSSNGDSFGANVNIGIRDNNDVNILQNADIVIKVRQNLGAYKPKYITIGDQATSNNDANICVNLGSTSQESTTGIGYGLYLNNRLTVSNNDPYLCDIDQRSAPYNPLSYTMTGATLIGLRLGFDTVSTLDWQLCFTRDAGWTTSDAGDINTPVGFSDASPPTVYIGGDGATNINYIMGDPSKWIRVRAEDINGLSVDLYLPAYEISQIPNTP